VKVTVVSDQAGRIISVAREEDVSPVPSGIIKTGAEPAPGNIIHCLDLPPELQREIVSGGSMTKLHTEFLVELRGSIPRLIRKDKI
jgi:hypothetical protein